MNIDISVETYPSNQIQAEMPFNVPSEIFWKTPDNALLIYTSSLQPLVLIVASNSFPKILWKPAMVHPLLRVTLFNPHLLETNRERLKVGLVKFIKRISFLWLKVRNHIQSRKRKQVCRIMVCSIKIVSGESNWWNVIIMIRINNNQHFPS